MRVYYVSNRYDGCQYVRCLMPMIHNGYDGDKTSLRSPRKDRAFSAQEAINSDVVVFHRPDSEEKLQAALLLKKMGKKIVFDNDDTYKVDDQMKLGKFFQSKSKILDEFIKISDLVTTTTDFLADEYRQINQNVIVLPNCVDPLDWPEPLKNNSDAVRVGLFGSTTLNGDFEPITGLLKELSQRKGVKLVMFGLPPKELHTDLVKETYKEELAFWDSLDIEWQPFVGMADYFDTLNSLRLDLVLIPRKDNYFNRCKSNLKFLEASMLEIPVIAQGFNDGKDPYTRDIDGINGFIAYNMRDWAKYVGFMLNNPAKRREMGKTAQKYVLNNYSILENACKWEQAYETL